MTVETEEVYLNCEPRFVSFLLTQYTPNPRKAASVVKSRSCRIHIGGQLAQNGRMTKREKEEDMNKTGLLFTVLLVLSITAPGCGPSADRRMP
jgi:hypothetical protein